MSDSKISERFDVIVLGRVIGTASGWDTDGADNYQYFEFDPANGVNIPVSEVLSISYDSGTFETWKSSTYEGGVTWGADIIDTLKDFPKK